MVDRGGCLSSGYTLVSAGGPGDGWLRGRGGGGGLGVRRWSDRRGGSVKRIDDAEGEETESDLAGGPRSPMY